MPFSYELEYFDCPHGGIGYRYVTSAGHVCEQDCTPHVQGIVPMTREQAEQHALAELAALEALGLPSMGDAPRLADLPPTPE